MNVHPEIDEGTPTLVNIEAEQALLGALLRNNDVLAHIPAALEPRHFYERIHARIFETAAALIRDGSVANEITLGARFAADKTLNELGGRSYLVSLGSAATTIINAPGYAGIVLDLALRRDAIKVAETAILDLQALPVDQTGEQYVAGLAHDLSLLSENTGQLGTTYTAARAVTAAIDEAASAYQNNGKRIDAISTGLKALDGKIGGLVKADLVVVGARPSMGKTALGIQFLYNAALADVPGLFVSLEMRAAQLGHRLISMRTGVPFSRLGWGKISENEYRRSVEAAGFLGSMPFTIEDRAGMSLGALSAAVARAKARQPKLGLVILDYLALVLPGDRYRGRKVDELAEISAECKRIAKQFDVCFVALHQLSRDLEKRDNKRPTLADLRDSGAIEQDADIVIFPFRESYYLARDLEAADEGSSEKIEITDRLAKVSMVMELIVAKDRQGMIGTAKVSANMATNAIRDFDDDQPKLSEPF